MAALTMPMPSFHIFMLKAVCLNSWMHAFHRQNYILRWNLIENWAITGFSGQKSGTRIILSILQSFLQFL